MFCPKCATQNSDDARFCRACGADISLVPQALTGLLSESQHHALQAAQETPSAARRRKKKEKDAPSHRNAYENIFSAVAFLIIFAGGLIFVPKLFMVWIWMIIPAMGYAGHGIGTLLDLRREQKSLGAGATPPLFSPSLVSPSFGRANELTPPRETSEIAPPPASVTEGTTRHLFAGDEMNRK